MVGQETPDLFYNNMIVIDGFPSGEAILIDDVYTTGSHIRATSWFLEDIGISTLGAICCGRTCREQLPDPFKVLLELLDVSR